MMINNNINIKHSLEFMLDTVQTHFFLYATVLGKLKTLKKRGWTE
jgi:hypothetical protein